MGLFSRGGSSEPITCAFCNKQLGLNRFGIGKTASGKLLWKCPECVQKGGFMKIIGEKAYFCDKDGNLLDTPDYYEETRVKCDTCGHIYCYTQADLDENKRNADQAVRASILAVMNALGGTQVGTHASMAQAERASDKVVDFSKCPKCNSRNIRKLSKEEWEAEKAVQSTNGGSAPSAADELKKFKELPDIGAITQEEFDAKKKQLLGL